MRNGSEKDGSSDDEKSGGEKEEKKKKLLSLLRTLNATYRGSKLHQAIIQPPNAGELILIGIFVRHN